MDVHRGPQPRRGFAHDRELACRHIELCVLVGSDRAEQVTELVETDEVLRLGVRARDDHLGIEQAGIGTLHPVPSADPRDRDPVLSAQRAQMLFGDSSSVFAVGHHRGIASRLGVRGAFNLHPQEYELHGGLRSRLCRCRAVQRVGRRRAMGPRSACCFRGWAGRTCSRPVSATRTLARGVRVWSILRLRGRSIGSMFGCHQGGRE